MRPPSAMASAISFQHTAARRRLADCKPKRRSHDLFQHTAARRRLGEHYASTGVRRHVSTHSRPKAAGSVDSTEHNILTFQHTAARRRLGPMLSCSYSIRVRFNTQPPEGGWMTAVLDQSTVAKFQHTAARRRLGW